MRIKKAYWSVVLVSILFYQPSASAEERVARLTISEDHRGPHNPRRFTASNNVSFLGSIGNPGPQLYTNTFMVYRKEELDSKLNAFMAKQAEDAKMISELQGLVMTLQKNLRDMADVNDALAKRLDQIETSVDTDPKAQ